MFPVGRNLFLLLVWVLLSGLYGSQGMACDDQNVAWRTMFESNAILRSKEGRTYRFPVKVATTQAQQRAGFQHICSELIQDWGLLFVFRRTQQAPFHMQNVAEDLDIAFISEEGKVLGVRKMSAERESGDSHIYRAEEPYRYALEVGMGRLFSWGVNEGVWWLVIDQKWDSLFSAVFQLGTSRKDITH
jgi:uncharacterized membrane protein (UPF0127 family)